jgi:hypothetical protein
MSHFLTIDSGRWDSEEKTRNGIVLEMYWIRSYRQHGSCPGGHISQNLLCNVSQIQVIAVPPCFSTPSMTRNGCGIPTITRRFPGRPAVRNLSPYSSTSARRKSDSATILKHVGAATSLLFRRGGLLQEAPNHTYQADSVFDTKASSALVEPQSVRIRRMIDC